MPQQRNPQSASYLLRNARVARSPLRAERLDILIEDGRIQRLLPPRAQQRTGNQTKAVRSTSRVNVPASRSKSNQPRGRLSPVPQRQVEVLDLKDCLVLPGLINAHDHLEFSLFPKLGRGPYPNARAWAENVYHPAESPIAEHLCVPKRERLIWGAIKNLLGGGTTVCHHNPYEAVFDDNFPVRIVKRLGWAHSLAFSDDIEARFRDTPTGRPFVIHVAEGTDEESRLEIFRLHKMGVISDRTVAVHGVGLDEDGCRLVERQRASIIWCPSSNLFTLERTLAPGIFQRPIPVALGTDSAITAHVNLMEEIKVALQTGGLPTERVYEMVTEGAARVLRLSGGEGSLVENGVADLIVLNLRAGRPCDALSRAGAPDLQLVMVGGEIKLASEALKARLPEKLDKALQQISIEGLGAFWLAAEVQPLLKTTLDVLGRHNAVRLAGARVMV